MIFEIPNVTDESKGISIDIVERLCGPEIKYVAIVDSISVAARGCGAVELSAGTMASRACATPAAFREQLDGFG